MDYPNDENLRFKAGVNDLGIDRNHPSGETAPKVLEYKFSLDGLVADFDKEEKFIKHVDFVVCWTAGRAYKERFYLDPLLVKDEGSTRHIYGSTHKTYSDASPTPMFEVLVLEDLLQWYTDPQAEEARQKQLYRAR